MSNVIIPFELKLPLTSGRYSSTSSFLFNRVLSTLSRLGVCVDDAATPPWVYNVRSETLASSSQAFIRVLRASSPSPNRASTAVSFNGAVWFPDGEYITARDSALRVKPCVLTRGKASLSNAPLVAEVIASGGWRYREVGMFGNPRDHQRNRPKF